MSPKEPLIRVQVRGHRLRIPQSVLTKANEDFRPGHGQAKTPRELAVAYWMAWNPQTRLKAERLWDAFRKIFEC